MLLRTLCPKAPLLMKNTLPFVRVCVCTFFEILLNKLVTYDFHKADTKLNRRQKLGSPNCSLQDSDVWLRKICPIT